MYGQPRLQEELFQAGWPGAAGILCKICPGPCLISSPWARMNLWANPPGMSGICGSAPPPVSVAHGCVSSCAPYRHRGKGNTVTMHLAQEAERRSQQDSAPQSRPWISCDPRGPEGSKIDIANACASNLSPHSSQSRPSAAAQIHHRCYLR